MAMTNEEWAYLAGIIDGEGHIRVARTGNGAINKKLMVYNSSEILIDWIVSRLPDVYVSLVGANSVYSCMWTAGKAQAILQETLPYMVIKKQQAELFIEFMDRCSPGTGHHVPRDMEDRREEILELFKMINKRQLNG